jgi:outer membrane protein assembly factor BamB
VKHDRLERPRTVSRPRILLLLVAGGVLTLTAAACGGGGGEGWAAPAVGEDRMLVVVGDRLVAADVGGDRLWEFPPPESDEKIERLYEAPVTIDGTTYFGAYSGVVYAVDAATGRERWSYDVGSRVVGGVAVLDETVFVGDSEGKFYAIRDGELRWEFDAGRRVWSTPVVDPEGGTLFVTSMAGALYALDAESGGERWRFETPAAVASSPVLSEGTVYFGSFDKRLYAVDAETGDRLWASEEAGNWFWTEAVVGSDTVYAGNLDGKVYAFSKQDGRPAWDAPFEAGAPVRSSMVLVEDPGVLVAADRDGTVYGIDPRTGDLRWPAPVSVGDKVLADLSVAGDQVYVRTEEDGIWAVDPGTGRLEQISIPQ